MSIKLNLRKITAYSFYPLVILAVLILTNSSKQQPNPYLDELRTQYVDYYPSEEDKAKLTPLQYNVDRIIFEKALDVFLNSGLTSREREQIAPIIVNRIRFVQIVGEWNAMLSKQRERIIDKIERAIYIGVYDMAEESPRETIMDMIRRRYTDDPIAVED
jgi:hypothetical protein